ncbi:MAG: hypothetical protein U9R37_07990 [Campylobacterota bacterium]|nr:hypothetical protein [Campylobacterota bacterium]
MIFIDANSYNDIKVEQLRAITKINQNTTISLSNSYLENNNLYPALKNINYNEFVYAK